MPKRESAVLTSSFAETAPTSSDTSLKEHFQRPALLLSVLGAVTLIVYWISLSFEFVWDDIFQIVDNPLLRSWHNLPQIFLSDLWFHTQRGQLYYRPLFTAWSMLNYWLFRLKPWGWHLAAILIHVAAVLAVYLVARKLRIPYWTAALGAALFALHPIHIEAVSWISAASDSMVTFFYLLGFASFMNAREAGRTQLIRWYVVSLLLLACALLTKEMAVTFFVLAGLYVWLEPANGDGQTVSRKLWRTLAAAWPYALLTIGYLVLRKFALHALAATAPEHHSFIEFVLTLPYVLAFYLHLLVFPVGLTGLYYTPYLTTGDALRFTISLLALAGFAALLWYWRKRTGDRQIAFLGLWTLVTLVPALYLPNFSNGDFVRDRYAYLPSVGFILLLAKALRLLPGMGQLAPRSVQLGATAAIIAGFLLGAGQQMYWSNELLLFQRGHELYPKNDYATVGLARILERVGQNDRAIRILEESAAHHPWYRTYLLLAEAYARAGKQDAARQALSLGISLRKEPVTGETDLADLAGLYGEVGEYNQAFGICASLLPRAPELLSALYNCGTINYMTGHFAEAETLLSRAVVVAPDEPAPVYWLGRTYFGDDQLPKAQAALRRAIQLNPGIAAYHSWLGKVLEREGEHNLAQEEYESADKLSTKE